MNKRAIFNLFLGVFATILIANVGAFAQKTDCSQTTDDALVDAVYAKIKVKYANHMNHVNVVAKDGVVTLQGWATTKSVKKDIEKLAKKIACVKKVVNTLTIGAGGGCAPGYKPCGGICIPSTDTCNIGRGN